MFDHSEIREIAEKAILEIAKEAIPGNEKMEVVLKRISQFLDDKIEPASPLAEKLTDVLIARVIIPLVRTIAQQAFDELRAAGRV